MKRSCEAELKETAEQLHMWYQSGYWPLFGAAVALLMPQLFTVWLAFKQAKSAFGYEVRFHEVVFVEKQLEEFYNPLFALLEANEEVFKKFGPPSFPEEHIEREAAAAMWREMRDQFVLVNNRKISELITEKSHLVSEEENFLDYLRLKMHIDAYEAFQAVRSEKYSRFQFPKGINALVSLRREKLRKKLGSIKKDNN